MTTVSFVFIFTGKLTIAAAVGSLEAITKIILYFIHERFWDKLSFGKKQIKPFVIWFTGLPSSGKAEIANALYNRLLGKKMLKLERLSGESVRSLLPGLGFTKLERDEHVKRIGHLASMLEKNGIIVIASFVSPYRGARQFIRKICSNFIEVHVNTPLEICEKRDAKGLYIKAREGLIKEFTGISDPYELPENPEIIININENSMDKCVDQICIYLHNKNLLT